MRRGLGLDCGVYPAASGYASAPFTPLTSEQSARYNADRAVYNNCLQQSQGAPACPAGSSFIGGVDPVSGKWNGSCISTTTGRPITDTSAAPVIATDAPVSGRVAFTTPGVQPNQRIAPDVTRSSMPASITPAIGRGRPVVIPTAGTTGTTTPAQSVSAAPSSAYPGMTVTEDPASGSGSSLLWVAVALVGGYLLLGHK